MSSWWTSEKRLCRCSSLVVEPEVWQSFNAGSLDELAAEVSTEFILVSGDLNEQRLWPNETLEHAHYIRSGYEPAIRIFHDDLTDTTDVQLSWRAYQDEDATRLSIEDDLDLDNDRTYETLLRELKSYNDHSCIYIHPQMWTAINNQKHGLNDAARALTA
ncbi:hypothetical protein [Halopiger aswanensis]|uniref:Uncharacterized protein n=1 Tax=Halopiger aswanensis TaxID=148449 RepID=A0A419WQU7_9EURY|nr:hypothetical protein [Halopiger aswanensis]RKD97819.1 hypothetical protein ATJ93_0811 [Halopiger aswanensis]